MLEQYKRLFKYNKNERLAGQGQDNRIWIFLIP